MTTNTVVINVLGSEFPVKGEIDPEHILKIAESLNRRMEELNRFQKVKTLERTAVFTALNLEDELITLKNSEESLKSDISRRLGDLIERIDAVLEEGSGNN